MNMRIGLVCPYNMARGGGVQECVKALQAELTKRGHEVFIITPQPRENLLKSPPNTLLLGRGTDVKSLFHTTAQVSVTVNPDELQKTLAAHAFDVLHFHEPWVPILSMQILSRSNSKNLATFHAKLPDTVMSRTIERVITPYTKSILKYIDNFSAVSNPAAEYISSLTKVPITIIPNGIDLAKYTPQQREPKQKTILYVGRLEKRKGVKYLLKAYKELLKSTPGIRLQIVGDGPEKARLENMVQQWNLSDVQFLGFVSEAKKLQLLRQASLFCSPARYGESFGIVLLEAMACGIPIVAGNNPGYSAVLEPKAELSIVDPRRSRAFSRKLQVLLVDKPTRQAWKTWGLAYVKQFNYVNVVDQYEKAYKELVK